MRSRTMCAVMALAVLVGCGTTEVDEPEEFDVVADQVVRLEAVDGPVIFPRTERGDPMLRLSADGIVEFDMLDEEPLRRWTLTGERTTDDVNIWNVRTTDGSCNVAVGSPVDAIGCEVFLVVSKDDDGNTVAWRLTPMR